MEWQIINAECRVGLKSLEDDSVNTCVTSPPYFGLRDYGTGEWTGGDPECQHSGAGRASDAKTWDGNLEGNHDRPRPMGAAHRGGDPSKCRCGAIREDAQIGLEPTPDEFVQALVEVFREVRRVLRDDGTVWLNLGDSYAGSWGAQSRGNENGEASSTIDGSSMLSARQIVAHPKRTGTGSTKNTPGIKPKDLMGIPWMVAFALRADGWYLRQDIIWHKPNPMPESVTDRCTKAHEYVFLLSKSKHYYYDSAAIAEPVVKGDAGSRFDVGKTAAHQLHRAQKGTRFGGTKYGDDESEKSRTKSGNIYEPNGKRNKRSVWSVTTKPFKGAHFATFPPDLIEPCVLAGAPPGGVVIDPFTGSGTTGMVALRHGRSFVGCELNPEYAELARRRILDDAPLVNYLSEVAA